MSYFITIQPIIHVFFLYISNNIYTEKIRFDILSTLFVNPKLILSWYVTIDAK